MTTNTKAKDEEKAPQPTASGQIKQVVRRLFHATTPKKAKKYRETGCIKAPVRGFTTLKAAMAWAIKTNRTVILEVKANKAHKLPDHHNEFGEAWWNDGDVNCENYKCIFSAISDA